MDVAPPLHVVEEESFGVGWVERNWPAYIESKVVEAKLLSRGSRLVHIVLGVESIVASKVKRCRMKLLGAPLDDHADRARRRQAVFGAVVRRHGTEFGDGILRGKHISPAAAATVCRFATVHQPHIVADALAIETHVEIAASRSRNHEIRLNARSARREGLQ